MRAAQGDWDRDLLKDALESAGGVISEAARLLGISRAHTYRLYKRLKDEERGAQGSVRRALDDGGSTQSEPAPPDANHLSDEVHPPCQEQP